MIKIIDYKAGNAPSVLRAVNHLGFEAALINSPEQLCKATHIILPGVGSAGATMRSLNELGLLAPLERAVLKDKKLFLGICVGMQVLFEHSEEENTDCLGWLGGNVTRFNREKVRVPQMGWNAVSFVKKAGFSVDDNHFYFVNSYHANPSNKADIWGVSNYNGDFTAAVHRDNIYGTQFHAEKSGEAGLSLLKSFLMIEKGGN